MKKRVLYLIICLLSSTISVAQEIAILKYDGGGDWYANPTALPNLIKFCNEQIHTEIIDRPAIVEVASTDLFKYPIVFMTGHGNIFFNDNAVENLRNYLTSGGFLHISDNYGIDKYVRREFKKVFPNLEFREIPIEHSIYNQSYHFKNGIPKIHEHDNKPAQGFGIFIDSRLVCFYDYETDLSDGWEDGVIHNNSESVREKALKMGANILQFSFSN
jgi:hypothetical protein|tara:strand:- start:30876 stop:31523 length:648 start_codon:yes stop_codon:yes gene_type:complete